MTNEIPKRLLELKVADLVDQHFHSCGGVSSRVKRILSDGLDGTPIKTVGDLVKLNKRELLRIPNIGRHTVTQLEEMLVGLKIRIASREEYAAVYFGTPEAPTPPPDPIYAMKMHEVLTVNSYIEVVRVPGGWIYEFCSERYIFVPECGGAL